MKRVLAGFAISLLALSPAAFGAVHSASGSGRIAVPDEAVSFSAVEHEDGTSTGSAVVHDFSAGVNAQIRVNCLNVVGNLAIISGEVVRSSDPSLIGDEGIFEVVDNHATGSPDLMSPVNFYAFGTGVDCKVLAEYDLQPIESGNIHVR